jgi:hypothetical protein
MLFLNTGPRQATYVHIQCLSIASASARSRCYHDQLVFSDKVANAALFACRLVARVGLNIEFERCHERQEEGEEELEGEKHVGEFRLDEAIVAFGVVVLAIIDVGWMCFAVLFNRCLGHEGWWSEGVGNVPRRRCDDEMTFLNFSSTFVYKHVSRYPYERQYLRVSLQSINQLIMDLRISISEHRSATVSRYQRNQI